MNRNNRIQPRSIRKVVFAIFVGLMAQALPVGANEIIEQNPFDPGRKPWKQEKQEKEEAALPELTPKDLQIDAIIAFGEFRGIVAQLDGRLKGALPASAAGKVRILVGQNFGGGYLLAALEPNHVVVKAGQKSFTVPLLRKLSKGGTPPAPATQAQEQLSAAVASPPPPPVPVPAPPGPAGNVPTPVSSPPIPPSANPFAAAAAAAPAPAGIEPPAPVPAAAGSSSQAAAPQQAAAQPEAATSQPTSLLDAIRKAQEASKSRGSGAAAAPSGVPFMGKQ